MTKRFITFFEFLFFAFLIAVCCLLAFGKGYSSAVTNGISLWFACVLPSLFPYFFITSILSSLKITGKMSTALSPIMKRLFNLNGIAGYAFFISVISGYPVGAKTVSDLKNQGLLSDAEAVRASVLCSTSSPMFIISSVGAIMFKNSAFGIKLFLVHLLSVILTSIIFSFYKKNDALNDSYAPIVLNKMDNILYEGVYSAVISVLIVGGLITVFYLLTEILVTIGVLTPIISLLSSIFGENVAKSIVFGSFECTRGLKVLAEGGLTPLCLPVCALICGFGGLSVIAQSLAYLKKAKIKTAIFILAKIITAVIGFILGFIFYRF